MNVQGQRRMTVIPTLFVRTPKDPMSAAALKDMREMAKPVLVDKHNISHLKYYDYSYVFKPSSCKRKPEKKISLERARVCSFC